MDMYFQILLVTILSMEAAAFTAPVVKLNSPGVQTKDPGEWAEFTCSVACSHSIDWYVEGQSGDITETCSTNLDGMTICKEITQSCSSASSTSSYIETLRVLATTEMASSSVAVQCAAISLIFPIGRQCTPFLSYSRYALLTVRSLPTQPPTTPTPSPAPVVCPTSVQDVTVTSTATDTVTVIQDHTVTHTVMQTVVVEATPEPKPELMKSEPYPQQAME